MPFDGVVVSENVDVGQFVSMGSRLALVYGTDGVEVRVPLDSREMAWFDVPSRGGGRGSIAEVSASFGGSSSTWPAKIIRMEAQVDEMSRMVHVVAEVERPYDTASGRPVLLPGTFVDVSISAAPSRGSRKYRDSRSTKAIRFGSTTTARWISAMSGSYARTASRRWWGMVSRVAIW